MNLFLKIVLSMLIANQCWAAEHLQLKVETTIEVATEQFNKQFGKDLKQLEQSPLTQTEILNALAIAHNGWLWDRQNLSNQSGVYFRKKILPSMSCFYLIRKAPVRLDKDKFHENSVFAIYLLLSELPIDHDAGVASQKQINGAAYLPIRISAPTLKKEIK